MNIITQDFLQSTKILDIHQEVKGVEEVMEFLTSPDVVNRMLVASDMGLPALTPIVQELENRFDDTSNFPVCVMGSNKNAVARQNISASGWRTVGTGQDSGQRWVQVLFHLCGL